MSLKVLLTKLSRSLYFPTTLHPKTNDPLPQSMNITVVIEIEYSQIKVLIANIKELMRKPDKKIRAGHDIEFLLFSNTR